MGTIARRGFRGIAAIAFDVASRKRRIVGLVTLALWILAVTAAFIAHMSNPTPLHRLVLILLLALFVVVHLQATITAWTVSRDWRRMLALLYSARYLSEVKGVPGRDAFLLQLDAEMRLAREGGPVCTLVTARFTSLDTMRESFGDQFAHKAVEALGARLKRITRGGDVIGYIGDGLFATLLVDCTGDEANQFVRRVPAAFPLDVPGAPPQDFAVQVRAREYDLQSEEPVDYLAQVELRRAPIARFAAQRTSLKRPA